jgi:hypothetical protein
LAEFLFKANTRYAFYLQSFDNDRPVGILYSTDIQNPTSKQQTKFYGDLFALTNGGTEIRWDDTGSALVRTNLLELMGLKPPPSVRSLFFLVSF